MGQNGAKEMLRTISGNNTNQHIKHISNFKMTVVEVSYHICIEHHNYKCDVETKVACVSVAIIFAV